MIAGFFFKFLGKGSGVSANCASCCVTVRVYKAMHAAIVLLCCDLKFLDHAMWGQVYRVVNHAIYDDSCDFQSVSCVHCSSCIDYTLITTKPYCLESAVLCFLNSPSCIDIT